MFSSWLSGRARESGRRGLGPRVEVVPSLPVRPYRHESLHGRRLRHRLVDAVLQVFLVDRHDHLDACGVVPVLDVVHHQKVRRRTRDRAELVEREEREPELVAAAQDQKNRVALPDPEGRKIIRAPVGLTFEIGEREYLRLA